MSVQIQLFKIDAPLDNSKAKKDILKRHYEQQETFINLAKREKQDFTRTIITINRRLEDRREAAGGLNSIRNLIERLAEPLFREIYAVFRLRSERNLDPNRLPEVMKTVNTLDEACKQLIRIAGIDKMDIEKYRLNEYGAGDIMDLCGQLERITGDKFTVSPYETPVDG